VSRLLVVQPDPAQADALREAVRAYIHADVAVAQSLEEALAWIDHCLPDVILLPTLMPAMVEDYLVAYLATIPGAGHVQILGVPRLERAEVAVQREERRRFPWQRRDWRLLLPWLRGRQPRQAIRPVCDPGVFSKDVVAYLAAADALRRDFDLLSPDVLSGRDRRIEHRFGYDELPWISYVRMGGEQAALVNLSAGGALLRMGSRPEHRFLKRADPHVAQQARLTLEVGSFRQVHALGRVIRCVPVTASPQTQYEIAFLFDDRAARAEGVLERLELPRLIGTGNEIVLAR
jgi:CheY-like chemotaxis protein